MGLKGFFLSKSHLSQIVFILIISYAISSINILVLWLGILPKLPDDYFHPYVLMGFSLASCVVTLFISAYHLSTMIRRRKRITDRQNDENGADGKKEVEL
jgi:hypothetical protein